MRKKRNSLFTAQTPIDLSALVELELRGEKLWYFVGPKGGGIEHGPKIFQQPTCHHRPEVFGGLDETKSATLLKAFFQAKR